ncbi:DUF6884 domain-containing protein [[Kitasatospora] papulosa]|uniref:DUF6884 domain-containing protein n=1 Tax=[Kitasatospora] papulosa TaxID=1464011 RepID=UPI00371F270F
MSNRKSISVPGQLRRYVLKHADEMVTAAEMDLLAACRVGDRELKAAGMNTLNTIELRLTNAAVGAALEIARDWLHDDNGNNVMAGKSMLKFELEYEPDDPREIRHQVKMPKSLTGFFTGRYAYEPERHKGESETVREDMKRMSWTSTGGSGRVRAETLGWLLDEMARYQENPHPATARAAKKFIANFTEPFERTQRLINGYLGAGDEDQAPDFTEAVHGPAEVEAPVKRLVVIACGGKKSDAPGKIPAEERYTGNYFRACLMAAEVMDGPTMILSAKHGFLSPSDEIENYDVKMGDKDSVRVATARQQIKALGLEDAKVTILGGDRYVQAARQIWPDAEAPLKGGIGQQLKQLASMYEGEVLEPDEGNEDGPIAWSSGQFRDVMHLPSRGRPNGPIIWFGGKAGKANPEPATWMKVKITYTGDGCYDLTDVETGESVLTCKLMSKIHWAHVVTEAPAPVEVEEPVKVEEKPAVAARIYEVPENWLELAEEGNTDASRRYWTRRCEEWRRTGK